MKRFRSGACIGAMAVGLLAASPSYAQDQAPRDYDVSAQDLKYALQKVARQSGLELVATSTDLQGKRAAPLRGHYTPEEAVTQLLAGTGLVAQISSGTIYIRGRSEPPVEAASLSDVTPSDIVVTGSRIRGAPIASPMIKHTQEEIRDAGMTTLADALRAIPQNFGAGQNPGVGSGVPNSSNASGASTVNLRGLGGDATLTLLNGHRLSYNARGQSIDISAIPLSAVDRVEIVADGASALYGSDAVAGVANIVLKRDYSGLSSSARFGASTEGGNQQQQYGAVGGATWTGGGIVAAYEFERDTSIEAGERSYAATRSPGLTLYPALKHHDAMLSGHQELSSNLSFEADAIFNKRWSKQYFASDSRGNYQLNGGQISSIDTSFAIAPSLNLKLPSGWRASLSGSYGQDHTLFTSQPYRELVRLTPTAFCYCNKGESIELAIDGPLARLPAGDLRVAFGGGFRSQTFVQSNENIRRSQGTSFGYGEFELPLVSPDQEVSLVHSLIITGAARYENYPGIGDIITPKFGFIFSPSADFDLKGSWGESFKAPTLFQKYFRSNVALFSATSQGGTGYAANATALQLSGGNPNLQPERATTWTATFVAHPRRWEGSHFELSYFNIHYRDRVVAPITFTIQSLSNPIYASLVTLAPSDAAKAAAIAGGVFFNITSAPFDPATVVAIIDNRNLNAASQSIHGVDLSADYRFRLSEGKFLTLTAYGSYIHSTQQLSDLQPVVSLAGAVFNPPHFRARGGAVWTSPKLTVSSFVNYIGGVTDVRVSPPIDVGSMTTLDLATRYKVAMGIELDLSIQNVFDAQPSAISKTRTDEHPFDSTNYTPFGRFISIGVTKKW